MNYLEAILLGLIQGLCEFLPVSSSGHLVLFANLLGISSPGLLLETTLHLGTLSAVLWVYWRDILTMLKKPFGREVRLLVIATIPAVIAAAFLGDFLDEAFSGKFLGVSFILTTALLWGSSLFRGDRTGLGYSDAAAMGCLQAAALLPGLSRSGSTISGGLFRGLSRESAARFSFLMSIPAILGSTVLQIYDIARNGIPENLGALPLLLGAVVAAASGLFAIRIMLKVIKTKGLFWFGLYTLLLGLFIVIDQNITHILF